MLVVQISFSILENYMRLYFVGKSYFKTDESFRWNVGLIRVGVQKRNVALQQKPFSCILALKFVVLRYHIKAQSSVISAHLLETYRST